MSSQSEFQYSQEGYSDTDTTGEQKPKIPIGKNEKVLEIINTNLDLDEAEEQILILKETTDSSSPIKIVIADNEDHRNMYVKAWEGITNATNSRIFKVELLDVVGDYSHQIVLHGMNARDLTLDIFKRTPSLSNPGLHFQPICQIISNGTIRIHKIERSPEYESGQKNGESFPVIVERKELGSKNDMDLIEETYSYIASTNRYTLTGVRNIPADVASQEKLSPLFSTNDEGAFLAFLKGGWFEKTQKDKLVAFFPETNQIVFSMGNVSEVYDWDYSRRTLFNGLMIVAHNILIKSIKININITARALNAINVSFEDDTWSGEYQKLNEVSQEHYYTADAKSLRPSTLDLSGVYEDEQTNEKESNQIIFEPPYFTWVLKQKSMYGGYSIIENIPLTNPNYYKMALQFLPNEVDNNLFTNGIRKKISTSSDDQLLSRCYTFDRNKNVFILNEETSRRDVERLWELFVSVQYRGYTQYKFGVITFKILKENGLVERIDNYVLEYIEKKEADKLMRTIVLTPGKLNVSGIEVLSRDSIRLTQVDRKND
jgi:hypothetical protein